MPAPAMDLEGALSALVDAFDAFFLVAPGRQAGAGPGRMPEASGSITGRVVDAGGAAVSGASVAVTAGDRPHRDIAAITTADGAFRLGGLAPGTYTLTARRDAMSGAAAVAVAPGQTATVELRLGS